MEADSIVRVAVDIGGTFTDWFCRETGPFSLPIYTQCVVVLLVGSIIIHL